MTHPAQPAHHFETVRMRGHGLTLAADAIGDPMALPVLFLHGGGQSRRAWRAGARVLADAGFRALTFDLRGHGDSDWDPEGRYDLPDYVADFRAIIRQFPGKVALVGHSRGGQTAFCAAAAEADKVAAVVLVDCAPYIEQQGVGKIQRFLQSSLHGFATLDDAADALAQFMEQPRRNNPAGLRTAMRVGADGRFYWSWDPKSAELRFLNPPSERIWMEKAIPSATFPTLLARAGDSDVVTEKSVRLFREKMPSVQVTEVPGVGHLLTGQDNDAFAPVILDFLRRVCGSAPPSQSRPAL